MLKAFKHRFNDGGYCAPVRMRQTAVAKKGRSRRFLRGMRKGDTEHKKRP